MVSAPVWGTGGRRFESCLPDQALASRASIVPPVSAPGHGCRAAQRRPWPDRPVVGPHQARRGPPVPRGDRRQGADRWDGPRLRIGARDRLLRLHHDRRVPAPPSQWACQHSGRSTWTGRHHHPLCAFAHRSPWVQTATGDPWPATRQAPQRRASHHRPGCQGQRPGPGLQRWVQAPSVSPRRQGLSGRRDPSLATGSAGGRGRESRSAANPEDTRPSRRRPRPRT